VNPLLAGAVLGGLAVIAGAFGAHALKATLPPEKLGVFEVAVRYQLFHALALLAAGVLLRHTDLGAVRLAAGLFLAGTVLFSGSLYALAFGAPGWLGAVTPLGGVLLIGGWGALAWGVRGS
jgi:uncharacterized membrane protein YgdD (TMEM256/DUF423 family)